MPTPTENSDKPAALASDSISLKAKAAYGFGGVIDMFGHYFYTFLVSAVFNLQLGVSPARIGEALMISRLFDACTDPLFGWLSDNTRSRWGRRRPYILVGSIASGLALPCLFMASPSWGPDKTFWFMLISLGLYAPLISCFNMPYQSLGSELTPNYHERTSIQSWKSVIQQFGGMACNWAVAFATCSWFALPGGGTDTRKGAIWAAAFAGLTMMLAGLANVIWVKERYYEKAAVQQKIGFFAGLKSTFSCAPFLVLLGIALIYAVPVGVSSSLGFYTTLYHVCGGDLHLSTVLAGWAATAYAICGFVGVPLTTWVSRRMGKRFTLHLMLLLGLAAFGSSWWLYNPSVRWLMIVSQGINGFATVGFWVILPSMCADVVDFDELKCSMRREGAFASCFSWVLKLSISVSIGFSGRLIEATGFDAALGSNQLPSAILSLRAYFAIIPAISLMVAWALVWFFPLTQSQMADIRNQLERRRGSV